MRLRLGCVRALHEATLRQLTEREALPWVGKGTRGERRGHTGAALRRGGEQSSTRAGSGASSGRRRPRGARSGVGHRLDYWGGRSGVEVTRTCFFEPQNRKSLSRN